MNKGKVELVRFESTKDNAFYEYTVEHNNGSTSVKQVLTINSVDGLFRSKWEAVIELDDFPPQETPEAAAHKLADWLERLASAIRIGEYSNTTKANFKDLDEGKTGKED